MGRNGKDNFRFSFYHFPGWTLLFGKLRKVSNATKTMDQDVAIRVNSRVNKLQNTIHITDSNILTY